MDLAGHLPPKKLWKAPIALMEDLFSFYLNKSLLIAAQPIADAMVEITLRLTSISLLTDLCLNQTILMSLRMVFVNITHQRVKHTCPMPMLTIPVLEIMCSETMQLLRKSQLLLTFAQLLSVSTLLVSTSKLTRLEF